MHHDKDDLRKELIKKRANEMQNGTWSEAEPIKASWEDNKLLQFSRKVKKKFKNRKD